MNDSPQHAQRTLPVLARILETVRIAGRQVLPAKVFGNVSSLADALAAWRQLPLHDAGRVLEALNQTDPAESSGRLRVHPRSLAFPFELRTRASDVRSLLSTVIRSEYEVFLRGASPEYIVDAGAFTGDFSALALSRFPQSKLVAVEPQEEAARIARLNLAPYGERAIVVQAAVWNADGKVNLEGDGTGANVGLGGGGLQIESMTMTTILERHGFPRIDLLKCDIEGAEAQVFSARDQSWLSSVSLLLIELHTPEAAASVRGACVNAGLHRHEQYRSTHAFRRTQQGDVGDLLSDI